MTDNLKTGKPDTAHDAPAHTPGIPKGGGKGSYAEQPGHLPDGRATPRRSTGVDPKARTPIHPAMPGLFPG